MKGAVRCHVSWHSFWHWGWEAVPQHSYMSSCLCSPSETGEGALAPHEEAFWSLSNVSFPPGDLLSTEWQCPPGHALLSSNMRPPDVLCLQPTGCSLSRGRGSSFWFGFVLVHLAKKGRSQCTELAWTWGITLKHKDPPISHSSLSSWGEFSSVWNCSSIWTWLGISRRITMLCNKWRFKIWVFFQLCMCERQIHLQIYQAWEHTKRCLYSIQSSS